MLFFQFKLNSLELDYHARDKFKRLVGDRYSKKTDKVSLQVDRSEQFLLLFRDKVQGFF